MSEKTIPLNNLHESLGGKMVPFGGFMMPVRYSTDIEEHLCVRNAVGVFDVSHMGEFQISGSGALDFIQKVSANDASQLFDGKIQYSYLPNGKGGVVDDLLVYRKSATDYFLVVNASNIEKDWNWLMQHKPKDVEMKNLSDELCLFAVQGPKATATLEKICSYGIREMDYYTFAETEIAGHKNIMISATGYTGAGGYEIYLPNALAEDLWKKIFEAGEEFGIKPIGLGARDTLRLEAGYCLYGNDIDDETSPLEAGLGWVTKFTKDFIDSEKLALQKQNGLKNKLVGLKMIERGTPRSHYEIYNESEEKIGEVRSGTQSPSLRLGIAIGFVDINYAKVGTVVYIKIREKYLKAEVSKMPFIVKGV
jgi:aminomethyltransferase